MWKDGTISIVEYTKNGDLVIDGLLIERPLTEGEARDEVARRALERVRAGECDSIRGAMYGVLDEDMELKRLYAGQ